MHAVFKLNEKPFVFSSLAVLVLCGVCFFFVDIPVARFFHSLSGMDPGFFEAVTRLGKSTWYLIVSSLAFVSFRIIFKRPVWANRALFVFVAVAGSGILNDVFKFLLGRYRPNMFFNEHLYGFTFFAAGHSFTSFPSGHANTITALTLALYLISNRYGYVYLPVAILVMLSRLVLCAHYPSDVIFGSYLAVVTTFSVKMLFEKKGLWFARTSEPGHLSGVR